MGFKGASFNAGRDQYIADGDQHITVSNTSGAFPPDVRPSVESLLRDAHRVLAPDQFERVRREIGMIEQDMSGATPSRQDAATRLERVTEVIKQGGSALTAGTSIVESITKLAKWIGPLAGSALAALASLA
jgi:hypothetical protein